MVGGGDLTYLATCNLSVPSYPLLLAPDPSLGPMSRSGKWPEGLAFAVDGVGCEMKANTTNCHICWSFKLQSFFVNTFEREKIYIYKNSSKNNI